MSVFWLVGASSGIGRALALRAARDGMTVAVSARRAERLDALAAESGAGPGRIVPYVLDVTDRSAVAGVVGQIESEIGAIDVLVVCAGIHEPMCAVEFSAATVEQLMAVNFGGPVNCLDAILPRMIARRSGRIALVASVAGYRGLPTAAAYSASKAAVIAMTEALRPELSEIGISIQVVNPGFVRTELTERNTFPMPFLMDVEPAAAALYRGLSGNGFEIIFPRRLAYLLKILRILPYRIAFAVTKRMMPKNTEGTHS